ncbi:hypothetical protein F5Y05DRAFT_421519 [Hypoxylon sp. FL0543]|nr:hypothetical protein F5Y05DRAFT_421519 [Hypoxylon sp. FL0543]
MDISPFAALQSPALALIYCGITVHLGICATLGFKVSRARLRNRKPGLIPPWLCQTIVAVLLTIAFAVLIFPFAFAVSVRTLYMLTGKVWYRRYRQWRKRRRGEAVDDELPSWNDDASSLTTIDGVDFIALSERPPDYSRHRQDARIDVQAAEGLLNPPPPAYLHSRDQGAASTQ